MAILEIEYHWIDALARRRRGKNAQPARVIVCDQCGLEGILPSQLHRTLYRVGDSATYICEIHAILARRRAPTPEFLKVVPRA